MRKFSDFFWFCISTSCQLKNMICLVIQFPSCYFSQHFFDTETITFWTLYITTEINWAKMNCTLRYPIFASSHTLRRACTDPSSKVKPEFANLSLDKRTWQIKQCSSQNACSFYSSRCKHFHYSLWGDCFLINN